MATWNVQIMNQDCELDRYFYYYSVDDKTKFKKKKSNINEEEKKSSICEITIGEII